MNTVGDNGGNVTDFITRTSGRYSENEIRLKLENLAQEGTIYSTVDDDHFAYIGEQG